MRSFSPITATGLLIRTSSRGLMEGFLGSCFAFQDARAFITAAHCVGDLPTGQIAVWVPGNGPIEYVREGDEHKWTAIRHPLKPVVKVVRHDTADLAILWAADEAAPTEPFWGSVGNFSLGEEFHAFGYPENVLGDDARMPTARLFTGHYQRLF